MVGDALRIGWKARKGWSSQSFRNRAVVRGTTRFAALAERRNSQIGAFGKELFTA
jgi:hypothetical protein